MFDYIECILFYEIFFGCVNDNYAVSHLADI